MIKQKYIKVFPSILFYDGVGGEMMEFLYTRDFIARDKVVVVNLDTQASVKLMDDWNFNHYKNGRQYTFYGEEWATKTPVRIRVPHSGMWNIVIDLAGGSGTIRHSIEII